LSIAFHVLQHVLFVFPPFRNRNRKRIHIFAPVFNRSEKDNHATRFSTGAQRTSATEGGQNEPNKSNTKSGNFNAIKQWDYLTLRQTAQLTHG
jgi:hypothetical protein